MGAIFVLLLLNMLTGGLPITCGLLLVSMGSYYFWRDVVKSPLATRRAIQTGAVLISVWGYIVYVMFIRDVKIKL